MSHRAVLHSLIAFGIIQTGLSTLIQTHQTVTSPLTEDAHLTCWLTKIKDIVQVTWLKDLPYDQQHVASYTQQFGQKVNPDFKDKVEFTEAALQNSSIVIRKVTEEDGGCYFCVFNVYPEGRLMAKTCLQLFELYKPVLLVEQSPEEAVVSCSATGRPAPTVNISVPQQDLHFSDHRSVSINNTNGTVTVTVTTRLSGFHGSSIYVCCTARVLSGPQMKEFMTIPGVNQSFADDLSWIVAAMIVSSVLVCVAAVTACLFLRTRRYRSSMS